MQIQSIGKMTPHGLGNYGFPLFTSTKQPHFFSKGMGAKKAPAQSL